MSETATKKSSRPTVFAVIPVFNRLALTRDCLRCLQAQSYSRLVIIVADGGSSDGTEDAIKREYPSVVLIRGDRELWWTGAMRVGIEYALEHRTSDEDVVLMMNNDTLIDSYYVETLVRVSREHKAAVGGLIVDSEEPSRIVDAGESIDWESYTFPVKTTVGAGEVFYDQIDLLSGRGTLVPMTMILQAGNVNAEVFPHYIADCEFFCRLRRHGFRLGVSYEAVVLAKVAETGIVLKSSRLKVREAWELLFSERSAENIRNHWRFIHHCAPVQWRSRAKRLLVLRQLRMIVLKTWMEWVAFPFLWCAQGLRRRSS
ncbi:Putative glycosyltransferase (fragment) [Nitrospira japonica]|uniref:Putative glycosyltransferase n=1 Tax=Nitrospira japonica TaxID=1325564 RepID=A0A1W1I0A3_9BACT